jgi:DNA replication and repair protein RecF
MLRALATIDRLDPARSAALSVRRLALRDFRNYRRLRLEVEAGPVVLFGENGAGKTNLLEAVSLLAPGRGLRRAKLGEIDRHGGGPWSIKAELSGRVAGSEIETARDPELERRAVTIDGTAAKGQASLAEVAGVVWLTPSMDRIFLEGPSARRRFLDRLVLTINPAHASHVSAYERVMRDRSLLLRERRGDPAWLSALERRMAEAGVTVAAARREVVIGLSAHLGMLETGFPLPSLALEGEVEGSLEALPAVEAERRLAELLAASRSVDAEQGGATHGVRRSDLVVRDAATGAMAADCSTGRQKSLLVSIALAEARLRLERQGDLPILLLDEVTAHLDVRRRGELLETLAGLGAQAWLTGTDAELFAPLRRRAQFFHVHEATLNRDE